MTARDGTAVLCGETYVVRDFRRRAVNLRTGVRLHIAFSAQTASAKGKTPRSHKRNTLASKRVLWWSKGVRV